MSHFCTHKGTWPEARRSPESSLRLRACRPASATRQCQKPASTCWGPRDTELGPPEHGGGHADDGPPAPIVTGLLPPSLLRPAPRAPSMVGVSEQ